MARDLAVSPWTGSRACSMWIRVTARRSVMPSSCQVRQRGRGQAQVGADGRRGEGPAGSLGCAAQDVDPPVERGTERGGGGVGEVPGPGQSRIRVPVGGEASGQAQVVDDAGAVEVLAAGDQPHVLLRQWGVCSEVGEQDAQGADAPAHAAGVPAAALDVGEEPVQQDPGGRGQGRGVSFVQAGPVARQVEELQLARQREVFGDRAGGLRGVDGFTALALETAAHIEAAFPAARSKGPAEPELVAAVQTDAVEVVVGLRDGEHTAPAVVVAQRQQPAAPVARGRPAAGAPVQTGRAPLVPLVRPGQALATAAQAGGHPGGHQPWLWRRHLQPVWRSRHS